MTGSSSIVVRADAGVRMGAGHVMRCLGLAQEWQESSGQVVYAMAAGSAGMAERLHAERIKIVSLTCEPGSLQDADMTAEVARSRGSEWIVLDGYHFTEGYQRRLKEAGSRLLLLDDLGNCRHYWADLILNQDVNAAESLYDAREPYARLLLGTHYVLLRREFRRVPKRPREPVRRPRSVLVTMGGSDPNNVTWDVLEALAQISGNDSQVLVVVGPSNPHGPSLKAAAKKLPRAQLLRNPPNLPELMAGCDMAITAGGGTVWELAYFGVPSIVVVVAENQRPCAEELKARNACRVVDGSAGDRADALAEAIRRFIESPNDRAACAARFSVMVDGLGAVRVCEAMKAIS